MNQMAIYILISLPVLIVIILVLVALISKRPELSGPATNPPPPPLKPPPPILEWLITAYKTATSLYIEVDREIWQIATIFLSASLLIMGWVVTKSDKLDLRMVIIMGCASIMLVGIATLFKLRLRNFNLIHIEYMRRLEEAAVGQQNAAEYWGLHHARKVLKAGKLWKHPLQWSTSIHGIMVIYFVLFIVIWVALCCVVATRIPIPSLPAVK